MMQPQFRKKDAQRRGAMITRSLAPLLSVFTEWARRRSNRAGTKVGTARGAQFSAITVHAAAGEERNRILVTSLEGTGRSRCSKRISDKTALFRGFDHKRVIGSVRTAAGSIISLSRKLPAIGRIVVARPGEAEAAMLGKKTCEPLRSVPELHGLATSNSTAIRHGPCGRKYARSSRP
jgi:hypothetical protein